MDKVKQMVAAGVSLPAAIKEALKNEGMTVSAFCSRYGMNRVQGGEILNLVRSPDARTCDGLARELGGQPFDWALLLWEHARPVAKDFAPPAVVAA